MPRWLLPLCLVWLVACRASGAAVADPAAGEVPLPCAAGWQARLLLDNEDVGVWTVGAFQVFEQYATPEVVALDDRGRCHVLISYSGKWTALPRVHDGAWLGGLAHGDVDPRVPGPELYTGGKGGNLYQLRAYQNGALDARLIATLPGLEIHTVVAGELDGTSVTPELLVFTRPGSLYRVTPDGPDGGFRVADLGPLRGRVRDAVLLPRTGSGPPEIATASRDGRLRILRLVEGRLSWTDVHEEPVGVGRVTVRARGGGPLVLYTTLDDGRVQRHERGAQGWTTTTIHRGAQGLRGIASGRFHADPAREAVAVFGYGAEVLLLSRAPGGSWNVERLFTDRDRGHWLAVAELDGRNGTDELVGSGYGGRVFLLARDAGYGTAP